MRLLRVVPISFKELTVSKMLKDCFSSRYTLIALVGLCLLAAGLLAWGLAPTLLVGALPVLGIIACLLPCLLPLYWLRQSNRTSVNSSTTRPSTADPKAPAPVSEQS